MPEGKKKKKIIVPRVTNGLEEMVEIEVDDDGASWPERDHLQVLHKRLKRVDGPDKVSGKAVYTHDVRLPGMLYGRILLSPHPHARVTKLDISQAQSMPGVKAALTVPNKIMRFQGDPVAALAAETPEQAEDALRAIQVSYEVQPFGVDPLQALARKSSVVFDDGDVTLHDTKGDRAAVEASLSGCAAVSEGEFRTAVQHHCCLETHGVVVDYRGGESATVYASTQGTFSIPRDAASKLGLSPSQVKSVVHHMGGGFGSKFGLDVPGALACELSRQSKRPVHLMLTRRDEFLLSGNRSGSLQRLKLGADREGKLVALVAEQFRFGGLGEGSQRAQPHVYKVSSLFRQITSVHTHWDSSRAFRAPGSPQAAFAMESILDDLAARLDLDPIEIRKRNCDVKYHHQLDQGAQKIGWATGRNRQPGSPKGPLKRGMGVGLAQWGGGGSPACKATVRITADGKVEVSLGSQDLGTGTRTYMGAIVAEVLGLPMTAVQARLGESTMGRANMSGGSTTTASVAPAVKDAAEAARRELLERLAPVLGHKPETFILHQARLQYPGGKSIPWAEACSHLGKAGLTANGEWRAGLSDNGVEGVQFAEVEVDVETGKVRVVRMVGVQNCGLPLNLLALESQFNGGMIQGMGLALWEEKITDAASGRMLNANFSDYKLPGSLEMPEFFPIIDEGDKRPAVVGFSEPCTIPTAGAIANAVFNACGVRIHSLPITPDKILEALRKK